MEFWNVDIELEGDGALDMYEDAFVIHIYKHVKFQLDWHLRKVTKLCIGLSGSSGNAIPSYKCWCMHERGSCLAQNNVKALSEKLGHFGVQQTYSLFLA
jgi:hypothetical protein